MNIAYIIMSTPMGKDEQHIITEISELIENGNEVLVLPLIKNNNISNGDYEQKEIILKNTLFVPPFSKGVIIMGIVLFIRSPLRSLSIVWNIITKSKRLKNVRTNLSLLFKSLTLSEVIKRNKIDHIHAQGAGVPSTAAYIAYSISDIPWSFTCSKKDISENNIFMEKCKTSRFIRVIDEGGCEAAVSLAGDAAREKCHHIEYDIIKMQDITARLIELMK